MSWGNAKMGTSRRSSASCPIIGPPIVRRRSGIKGLVRHRRGQRCCLQAGGRRRTNQTILHPPARPATGPRGSERAWKKEQFRRSHVVVGARSLARGVFCDGREEEGEKEAPQSATSKSSPSHGRNLIHAEWNTATVFWPFYNFPRNSYMGSD